MTDKERKKNIEKDIKRQKIEKEICEKKKYLSDTDYQIIKCYESQLKGEKKPPYDEDKIISERDKIREEINELQKELEKI